MARNSTIPGASVQQILDVQRPPEPTDAELLTALSGDEAATFWCLWDRHRESLRQVCFHEMDGQAADAEDALSQVMLKMLACLPSHASEIRHCKAWLLQMARNLCVDLRRKRRTQ